MDAKILEQAKCLREMSSEKAADYLIGNFSDDGWQVGRALLLAPHVSWKPADQLRLARHFLSRHPQASPRPLETFAAFMSLKNFAAVIADVWPADPGHADLFRYHLQGVLKRYETSQQNRAVVDAILARHK